MIESMIERLTMQYECTASEIFLRDVIECFPAS